MMARLLGENAAPRPAQYARLNAPLEANGQRQHFMRASLDFGIGGEMAATPLSSQDSSLVSVLAAADCLIIRSSGAPSAEVGDFVEIMPLDF